MIMDDKSTLVSSPTLKQQRAGSSNKTKQTPSKERRCKPSVGCLVSVWTLRTRPFQEILPAGFHKYQYQLWALRALLWGFDRTPWSGLHFVTDHVLQPLIIPWETSECWKYESTHAISNTYSLHDTQLDTTSSIANHYLRHMDLSLNHLSTIMYFSLHLCADPNVCFVLGETATQRHNEKKRSAQGGHTGPTKMLFVRGRPVCPFHTFSLPNLRKPMSCSLARATV